ncbi:hypothetical protein [Micromonospora aurantiaca (nom. illeg.)]|uniref:hypothetical protein n=1 Tax=Micromonospora aurantiaca (nom. illeg.) TaxID=47850 RepID=UPI0033F5843C
MKYRTMAVRTAIAMLGVLAMTTAGQNPALAKDWRIAAQAEIDRFSDQNPNDYTGIDQLLTKYGLPPMKVRINGIDRDLTSSEAEIELAARKAAEAKPTPGARTFAVPTDAFSVAITLNYDLYLNRVVTGSWNFRDNYVNGSDPDDVATIQSNLGGGCFRTGALVRKAADYTGADYTGQTYIDDGGVGGSPIFGIRDRTSGFKLLTDNGYFKATYNKTGASGCGSTKLGAQFQYEHNQDGSGGFSASAGWGFFNISYANGGSKLRKGTSATYL